MLFYFRRDLHGLARGFAASLRPRGAGGLATESRLAWALILGTVPAGIVGLLIKDWVSTHGRDPRLIATTAIVYGLLLAIADRFGPKRAPVESITTRLLEAGKSFVLT